MIKTYSVSVRVKKEFLTENFCGVMVDSIIKIDDSLVDNTKEVIKLVLYEHNIREYGHGILSGLKPEHLEIFRIRELNRGIKDE